MSTSVQSQVPAPSAVNVSKDTTIYLEVVGSTTVDPALATIYVNGDVVFTAGSAVVPWVAVVTIFSNIGIWGKDNWDEENWGIPYNSWGATKWGGSKWGVSGGFGILLIPPFPFPLGSTVVVRVTYP
jgi:hypothetical protein